MEINLNNPFLSYILTPQQVEQGSILSDLQVMCIRNQISELAQEKLALNFDPANPTQYWQAQAELAGQINALQHLLTLSAAALSTQSGV